MTIESAKMGEQPIFTTKAHVFHIDPQTKRSWIPASSQAVSVNFFYDSSRNLYRIISVENAKAVVNSTITPNMTFTKTSQKFGQWSDIRANTVYGLGFSSEAELNKFIEKFQEVKETTRSAAQQKTQNGTSTTRTPALTREETINDESDSINLSSIPIQPTEESRGNLVSHQRSQSLSGLQASKLLAEAPKFYDSKSNVINQSSFEAQLKYENERLKLALAQSSTNAKKWEVELQTLKNNNTRLTNALQESTANVEEWKKQLQLLKDENNKMRIKTLELEASNGNPEAIAELRKEIINLSSRAETLEIEVRQKDKEIEQLKQKFDEHQHIYSTSQKVEDKLKALVNENENLKSQLNRLQDQSEGNKLNDKSKKGMFDQLNSRLAQNIVELKAIQKEFTNLLST